MQKKLPKMEGKKPKIAHLTSAHSRYDTRIFLKECSSLAKAGFDVSLVVADGAPDEKVDGVSIYGVEKATGRLDRIRNATKRVYEKALAMDSDVYHLHDPELMPVGLKLKKKGKKVIFDAHEDLPLQLLNKHYSKKWVLKLLSKVAAVYERYACKRFDGIVAATPTINAKFKRINPFSIAVNNYPILKEIVARESNEDAANKICYVGGIAKVRGIFEMLEALGQCSPGVTLLLAGSFGSEMVERQAKASPYWRKVDFLGFLDRKGVADTYRKSLAGLVILHPIPNYLDALPVKMFEYMGVGLPVIASNIPLWQKIIDEAGCGICVDPLNPKAIAGAIQYIQENPDKARKMGLNGRKAVQEKYNWSKEEGKLIGLYCDILS